MEDPNLNLHYLLQDSTVNGPGFRDVIWVQGCAIQCPGCFNQALWSFEPKFIIPVSSLIRKFGERKNSIEGISILGGEPFHQPAALCLFLEGLKASGLSTVVYTGFTFEYLQKLKNPMVNRMLEATDILIDGPFKQDLKDLSLVWRGSSNQRILFLSSRYSAKDLPPIESCFNKEIHVFSDDGLWKKPTGIWDLSAENTDP